MVDLKCNTKLGELELTRSQSLPQIPFPLGTNSVIAHISQQGSARNRAGPDPTTSYELWPRRSRIDSPNSIRGQWFPITAPQPPSVIYWPVCMWNAASENVSIAKCFLFFYFVCPLSAVWMETLTWKIKYGAMPREIQPIFCPVTFWNVGTDCAVIQLTPSL